MGKLTEFVTQWGVGFPPFALTDFLQSWTIPLTFPATVFAPLTNRYRSDGVDLYPRCMTYLAFRQKSQEAEFVKAISADSADGVLLGNDCAKFLPVLMNYLHFIFHLLRMRYRHQVVFLQLAIHFDSRVQAANHGHCDLQGCIQRAAFHFFQRNVAFLFLIAQSSGSSPADIHHRMQSFAEAQMSTNGTTTAFHRMLAQGELLHMSHPNASSMSLRITEQFYLELVPSVSGTVTTAATPASSGSATVTASRKKRKRGAKSDQPQAAGADLVMSPTSAPAPPTPPTATTGTSTAASAGGPPSQRAPCFHFFSKEGCSRTQCSFAHGAVPAKGSQAMKLLRENLTSRGLTPAAVLDN
jgi:hypothetical protein